MADLDRRIAGVESATADLVLVRHGETTWNRAGLIQGNSDEAVLTELGREQVRAVAARLVHSGVDVIVSSDLIRATETARIIADVLARPLVLDVALRERSFGVLEGTPVADLAAEVTGIARGVVVDDRVAPEGGESLFDLRRRVGIFVERAHVRWPSRRVLVVTHGGVIWALQAHRDAGPLVGRPWTVIGNAEVWSAPGE